MQKNNWYEYCVESIRDNGNGFARVFLKNDRLADQTVILHQCAWQANIGQRLVVNAAALQRFLVPSYDNEVHEHTVRDLNVETFNSTQMNYICSVFLHNKLVEQYTKLSSNMCAFIKQTAARNTGTIMSIIPRIQWILDNRGASAINVNALRWPWMAENTWRRRNANSD